MHVRKHGLTSKAVTTDPESAAEVHAVLAVCAADLGPVSPAELLLVEQMVGRKFASGPHRPLRHRFKRQHIACWTNFWPPSDPFAKRTTNEQRRTFTRHAILKINDPSPFCSVPDGFSPHREREDLHLQLAVCPPQRRHDDPPH